MAITHYLTVQTCKRVFFDPLYGVVRSVEPLELDDFHSTQPLCLFGVSVDNLPLQFTQYCKKGATDFSASLFLKTFWDRVYSSGFGENAKNITGLPDILIIDHRAKGYFQKNFFDWLQANGVEYQFSESTSKKAIAKFRQHQEFPHIAAPNKSLQQISYSASQEPYALSIDTLNSLVGASKYIFSNKSHFSTIDEYLKNSLSPRFAKAAVDQDVNLSQVTAIQSKSDQSLKDAVWSVAVNEKGDFGFLMNRYEQTMTDAERYEKKAFLAAIKALLENQINDLFTERQKDLIREVKRQNYKDTISIDDANFADMCLKLGFTHNPPFTTLVFNTVNLNRSEVVELWDQYSGGGDVEYSCEILPPKGYTTVNNKTCRLFYLSARGNHIFFVCLPDSVAAKAFDNGDCLNHMREQKHLITVFDKERFSENFIAFILNNPRYPMLLGTGIHSYVMRFGHA